MPTFNVTGDVDPFLHISLEKGESIFCESGSMVMMEQNLELKGSARGGILRSLTRAIANDASFFQQTIEAKNGKGECLLAAPLPGAIHVLEIGAKQYTLGDSAFLAASSDVELRTVTQSLGNALIGNSSGFLVSETTGQGKLAINAFGTIFKLTVSPGEDVLVDNNHVICWQTGLNISPSVSTRTGGLINNIINSAKSGEGIVLKFSGEGEVYISSKNTHSFSGWVRSLLRK